MSSDTTSENVAIGGGHDASSELEIRQKALQEELLKHIALLQIGVLLNTHSQVFLAQFV